MAANEDQLSAYEITRARNIERNNQRLRELGLISVEEERLSNQRAWHRPGSTFLAEDAAAVVPSSSHKRSHPVQEPTSPSRKSRRLQGLGPDGTRAPSPLPSSSLKQVRHERVLECRQTRQRLAIEYAKLGVERAARENPTATYEHCLMRVRSMSDQALRNRIRTIERAAGKHCVVKMAIFKSCLQDQGYWALAEAASESLERLKALKPLPSE